MENLQFAHLAINIVSAKANNIYEDVFILPRERRGFAFNDQIMVTPIYFYRVIGIEDKDKYEKELLQFHKKLKELGQIYFKIDQGFDKFINNDLIQKASRNWELIERIGLSSGKIIVDSSLKNNIISPINPVKDKLIRDKLAIILNIFMEGQSNINIVKNFYIKFLYWIEKYVICPLAAYEYGNINPKILFYGDIQRDEIYFLILLSLLGFDVIYFHPDRVDSFNGLEDIDRFSHLIEYPYREALRPFPRELTQKRKETVAYRASVEIDQVLHTEDSGIYRPWQFENYKLRPSTLKTTYEELLILWKEEARFREGFRVEDGSIYIPNIFAKISGVPMDINEYWNDFNKLTEDDPMTIFIDRIPFNVARGFVVSPGVFNMDGSLNKERVKDIREYNFSHLRTPVQNLILDKTDELIRATDLFIFPISKDFKAKILYTVLALEKKYLDILQKFDYPLQLPKLVIFDNSKNIFSQEDLIIIAFLHLVGFDIVILTPTGYNNIENGINKYYYDLHIMEDFKFDLKLEEGRGKEESKSARRGWLWFL